MLGPKSVAESVAATLFGPNIFVSLRVVSIHTKKNIRGTCKVSLIVPSITMKKRVMSVAAYSTWTPTL